MSHEQILWGVAAILLVFLLNQVFGRMISKMFDNNRRDDSYVGRREHNMCNLHTTEQFRQINTRFDAMEAANHTQHEALFGKLEEIRDLVRNNNGFRPPVG